MAKVGPSHPGGHVPRQGNPSISRALVFFSEVIGSVVKKFFQSGVQDRLSPSLRGRVSQKHPHDKAGSCAQSAGVGKRNRPKKTK